MTERFHIEDIFLHRKLSEIACHPTQALLACTVSSADREEDAYRSRLWRFEMAPGTCGVQITEGPGLDSSPCWSPDGQQLAFLSNRSGGPAQVHVMPLSGGEARALSQLPQGVSALRWLPSGRALIVTAALLCDPDAHCLSSASAAQSGSADEQGLREARRRCQPEVAWRLPYKEDGVGHLLRRQFHLWRVDAKSRAHVPLTQGAFDVLAFDIACDGRIAYTRTREGRFAHNNELWVCEEDGSQPRRLIHDIAIVMAPTWSRDGRTIAFTGAREEGDAEPRLWLVDGATGQARTVCESSLDVAHPAALHWDEDGQLVLTRASRGRHQIVRVDPRREHLDLLLDEDHQIGAFACTASHLLYTVDHPAAPCELWCSAREGSSEASSRAISQLNPWRQQRRGLHVQCLRFEVPDGEGGSESIEGWLLREAGQTQPMPVLDLVHGGPASYALLDFASTACWRVLCQRGWAVLLLNAVGSASYGRQFCRRLAGRWGQLDLPQHLAALAQLQAMGIGDGRSAIAGSSYGGYLSAWATGQAGCSFSAAVVMAPVGNIEAHYGTSDGGYYADPYYVASKPVFDRDKARELSPQYVQQSGVPTLFLQGKDDERCPRSQAEELFVSLSRAGDTPCELVLYPGQTHSFLISGSPSCRIDALARIVAWLGRFAEPLP